jgi:hypothetical protein
MAVMLLDHARIDMAEVLGDDQQRHASHNCQRRPGVAQRVEAFKASHRSS